jgi:hypothetical protein
MRILFLVLLIAGCSKPPHIESVNWNGLGAKPQINMKSMQPEWITQAGSDQVHFYQQNVNGAWVEGSFVKELKKSDNQTKYLMAEYASRVPKKSRDKIETMLERSPTVVPELMNRDSRFKKYKFDGPPTVVIVPENDFDVFWKLVFFDEQGLGHSVLVSQNYVLSNEQPVGSSFHEASAWVYPEGPKASELKEVTLDDLTGDGSLTSASLSVVTESVNKAREENQQFKFSPNDEKFDQVQMYFYVDKALSFFKDKLKVTMPFAIRGVSSLGFPEKTNSAFYYSGQIRLGAGDDVTFSKIPQDPSIVIHETCHALIEALAKLPYQGEGGSLNEGFSDFFTTVLLKNPKLGEASYKKGPFKRTVENDKKVSDKKGALYADSGIVSGTLWEIYQKLGQEKSLQFALDVLTRLGPNSNFEQTGMVFKDLLNTEYANKDQEVLKTVLKERGWL